jgi:hypothetical protein
MEEPGSDFVTINWPLATITSIKWWPLFWPWEPALLWNQLSVLQLQLATISVNRAGSSAR